MFNRIRRVTRKSIALGLIFALSGAVNPAHAADAFSFVGKSQPGEFFFAVSEGSDFFISSLQYNLKVSLEIEREESGEIATRRQIQSVICLQVLVPEKVKVELLVEQY